MIIVDQVTRTFQKGTIIALENISFSVKKGERVGLIGKNGVGKSTLLKMIAGILKPSSGRIWTMEKEASEALEQNRLKLGCLFTSYSQLMPSYCLEEAYEWQRALYHIPMKLYEEMFENLGKRLGLHHFYKQNLKKLSIGQRRCGEFFAAVMHRPELLLLDEPTIGMDEASRLIFNAAVSHLNQTFKMTILTASHDLQSLEQTSERVLLLQNGKLSFDGKWKTLKRKIDFWRQMTFVTEEMIDLEDVPVQFIGFNNGKMELLFRESQITTEELYQFLKERANIQNFSVSEPELEKVICEVLKEETLSCGASIAHSQTERRLTHMRAYNGIL